MHYTRALVIKQVSVVEECLLNSPSFSISHGGAKNGK